MTAAIEQRWQKGWTPRLRAKKRSTDRPALYLHPTILRGMDVVTRLKQERQRCGLSLADMLRRTGMSRKALSRLENDESPNPTVRPLARYAAAVGLELHIAAKLLRS